MTDATPQTPEAPEGHEPGWDERLKERRKRRGFATRSLLFITGLSTHERIASWAFKKPLNLDVKKKRKDLYDSADLIVSTWGKPWMKRRILVFSIGRIKFKGLQVGTIGLFTVGLGVPCLLLSFSIYRLVTRVKRRIATRPAAVHEVQKPTEPPSIPTPSK